MAIKEGTTTTPFDMVVLNKLDRFHLAGNAIRRLPVSETKRARFQQFIQNKLDEHKRYTETHGEDLPEIRDWKWTG
jgi:xylulose-5-phosphate/fructose-6-phosphate phosphoketolase